MSSYDYFVKRLAGIWKNITALPIVQSEEVNIEQLQQLAKYLNNSVPVTPEDNTYAHIIHSLYRGRLLNIQSLRRNAPHLALACDINLITNNLGLANVVNISWRADRREYVVSEQFKGSEGFTIKTNGGTFNPSSGRGFYVARGRGRGGRGARGGRGGRRTATGYNRNSRPSIMSRGDETALKQEDVTSIIAEMTQELNDDNDVSLVETGELKKSYASVAESAKELPVPPTTIESLSAPPTIKGGRNWADVESDDDLE